MRRRDFFAERTKHARRRMRYSESGFCSLCVTAAILKENFADCAFKRAPMCGDGIFVQKGQNTHDGVCDTPSVGFVLSALQPQF